MQEEEFLKDLKWSIEETERKNSFKPTTCYKPSSMTCIRNMYYQATGTDPDPSTTDYCLVNICNSGSDIHVRLQKEVEDMKTNGIDCEYIDVGDYITTNNIPDVIVRGKSGMETKLHHERYNMNFMCDGVIKYKGEYYILELKTETSRKWMSRLDVDDSHKDQATAYSLSLGLEKVLFIYVNRDFLDMKSFMLTVTDEMRQALVNKITTCDSYVNSKTVPPKPFDLQPSQCKYCIYKSTCKKDL